jgi:ubiquinone/menaquinone biosynthesis C-methylase UbiE
MPWKYTDEYYREYTRTTWNESAEAYVDFMRNLEPFREELLAALKPKPGENVLDLGCGPGEPSLTISRLVGPMGHVTGLDLSEKMVAIAQSVASARGAENADFRVMDCSSLTFGRDQFDAAVSSFGFQIFTNPEKAAAEAHRVLRPEGRIAVSVWSTGDKVPFLHAIVGPMLEHAEPDETGYLPTPYETGGPGEMVSFLESAGFRDAREKRVSYEMRFDSKDRYLDALLKATPIGHSLLEESPEVQAEVLRQTRSNLDQLGSSSGLAIPAECVIVLAHK